MTIKEAQQIKVEKTCKCGCNTKFYPFPKYTNGVFGYPEYIRGHHPHCRKKQFGEIPAWNKGITKEINPELYKKIGFQLGHPPSISSGWDYVNFLLKTNPIIKDKWTKSKKMVVPWNKGLTSDQYPTGKIKSGPEHGSWKGNKRGLRDLAKYKKFRDKVFKRDNFTCQECGARNYLGKGKTVYLHAHHIIAYSHNLSLAFDVNNGITLCRSCHKKTTTYGFKAIKNIKRQ